MGFFSKKNLEAEIEQNQTWGVILNETPDKKAEENLLRIFTERLHIPGEDALKIIHSVPILLFDDRSADEAEDIKMILDGLGARADISNDPKTFKKLSRISWPKRIEAADFATGVIERPLVPPAPSAPSNGGSGEKPSAPEKPLPPTPVPEDWEAKYSALQKSFLDTLTGVKNFEQRIASLKEEKGRVEKELLALRNVLSALEKERDVLKVEKEVLMKEKDEALLTRQEALESAEGLRKEVNQGRALQESLHKEINILVLEKERPVRELERLRTELENQLKKLLEILKPPEKS